MYLVGIALAVYRAFEKVAIERLVGALAIMVAVVVLADADGIVLLVAVDVVLVAMLAIEHRRVEVHDRSISVH